MLDATVGGGNVFVGWRQSGSQALLELWARDDMTYVPLPLGLRIVLASSEPWVASISGAENWAVFISRDGLLGLDPGVARAYRIRIR